MTEQQRVLDVTVENHGTIFLFRLHTEAAQDWVDMNVSESRELFGGALVVEHRYALAIAEGMEAEGLVVE